MGKNLPKIIEAKMEDKFFFILQITKLLEEQDFSTKLNSTEKRAWQALENFCRNFLGSKKAKDIKEFVQELFLLHTAMGCNMSMKLRIPHSH